MLILEDLSPTNHENITVSFGNHRAPGVHLSAPEGSVGLRLIRIRDGDQNGVTVTRLATH